jgi:fumarate reductase subunit D
MLANGVADGVHLRRLFQGGQLWSAVIISMVQILWALCLRIGILKSYAILRISSCSIAVACPAFSLMRQRIYLP